MAEAHDIPGAIHQNLLDAGCDRQTTERCMAMVRTGAYSDMIPLLARHKARLLHRIHAEQRQIDCLDYLVYKIERETR